MSLTACLHLWRTAHTPVLVAGLVAVSCFKSGAEPLSRGEGVERHIDLGASHVYRVDLPPHSFLRLLVEQRGIDVRLSIDGPDDRLLALRDSPTTAFGPESISLLVPSAGSYRIRVEALQPAAAEGSYRLLVADLRRATPADQERIRAEESFAEAGRLHWLDSAESLLAAHRLYGEAARLFEKAGEPRLAAWAALNRGEITAELTGPRAGLTELEAARDTLERLGDRFGELEATATIAYLYEVLGHKQRALVLWRRVLEERRAHGDQRGEANTWHNIAAVYESLGETGAAREHYERALQVMDGVGDRYGAAYTLTNLGRLHRAAGRYGAAFAALERALDLRREVEDRRGTIRTLVEIAALHEARGDLLAARDGFERALERAQADVSRADVARLHTRLGILAARRGRDAAARDHLQTALEQSRRAGDPVGEAAALEGAARAARLHGRPDLAQEHIETALDLVETVRQQVTSPRLRASFLAASRPYYELAIDVALSLERRSGDGRQLAIAFRDLERFRARSLLDQLRAARLELRSGLDPSLLERERRIAARVDLAAERHFRQLAGETAGADLDTARRELEAAVQHQREIQAEIRLASPRYAALTQPRPLDLATVQEEVLDAETLLIAFALGEERSHVFVIEKRGARSVELPAREVLDAAARRLYELLTARPTRIRFETAAERAARIAEADLASRTAAEHLAGLLLSPIAEALDGRRLAIIADGALYYVPFAALPSPADGSPLGERHEIVHLPSASVLAELRRSKAGSIAAAGSRDGDWKRLAVFADPVFAADDPRLAENRAATRRQLLPSPRLRRLPFTRREADSILRQSGAAGNLRALGFNAARDAFAAAGREGYDILHLATHALIDDRRPELSGILFSLYDEAGRPRDGWLSLAEVYNLELRTELVVLSACRTALGREVRGEGLTGLARGFMYAGAPRVVATLWEVDDEATAIFMSELYAALFDRGRRPAAALREAQLSMARDRRFNHPYFWAGFVLEGEWR